jgi:hypothetical protein
MTCLCVNSQMIYWDLANVKILNHSYFTINDLIRVVTPHATVMTSGPLTYLMVCGVNQYDHSTIDTRFKLQKVFSQFRSYRKGT